MHLMTQKNKLPRLLDHMEDMKREKGKLVNAYSSKDLERILAIKVEESSPSNPDVGSELVLIETIEMFFCTKKRLGGGAVFSGWVPFNSSMIEKFPEEAKNTPILWSHEMADRSVLCEAGHARPLFLVQAGVNCEFKAYPSLGHAFPH
ncbi:hypothetical protein CRYUN_Cryun18bG0042900 [Craigia yunnanensis]